MKALIGILGVLALSACPLQGGKNLTLGTGTSSSPTSTPTSSPASSTSLADMDRDSQAAYHAQQGQSNLDAANFLRAEFEALAGLPVEKAKAQAKSRGHTGEVKVEEASHFIEGCKDGIVCSATDERGGQSGMGNGEILILYVNKKLAIAPPPD